MKHRIIVVEDEPDIAELVLVQLQREGFEVGSPEASESGQWQLHFNRIDRLDEGRPDAFCLEILELLEPFEASYDGWGAALVRPPGLH